MTNRLKHKFENDIFDKSAVTLISSQPITFKHAATGTKDKRKGHEFIFKDKISGCHWTITLEPCYYSNGDRWLLYGNAVRYFLNVSSVTYAKNLTQAFNLFKKIK